tara:strand:+ start:30244 stop:30750 length:507 start_codon:yes stop_codon:yes gene_type:complete
MSYVPSHRVSASEALAPPNALVYIPSTTNTSYVTTGNVPLNTPTVWFGSWMPSITNNIITLPSGYYYFVESAQAVYYGTSKHAYININVYDETNSQNIGNLGKCVYWDLGRQSNNNRDNAAFAFIDCVSSGIDISIKAHSNNGIYSINYTDTVGYAGLGRTIIWRLDP